jgi:hypothetical protein
VLRRIAVVTALGVTGCIVGPVEPAAPARRVDVWVHDGHRARHAILDAAPPPDDRLLRWVWSDPPPRPGRPRVRELAWIFAGVDTSARLDPGEGDVLDHPDLETVRSLEGALQVDPPDVEAIVAGLPRVYRLASRGLLLEEAARTPHIHPASLRVLVRAVTTDRAQAALGFAPDGVVAGGEPAEALRGPLVALARRPDLTPDEARAIAEASADLPRSGDRAAVLMGLLSTSTPALDAGPALEAARRVGAGERRDVLVALAGHPRLDPDTAALAIEAALELPTGDDALSVLLALVGHARPDDLAHAADRLEGPARARLLGALGRG